MDLHHRSSAYEADEFLLLYPANCTTSQGYHVVFPEFYHHQFVTNLGNWGKALLIELSSSQSHPHFGGILLVECNCQRPTLLIQAIVVYHNAGCESILILKQPLGDCCGLIGSPASTRTRITRFKVWSSTIKLQENSITILAACLGLEPRMPFGARLTVSRVYHSSNKQLSFFSILRDKFWKPSSKLLN